MGSSTRRGRPKRGARGFFFARTPLPPLLTPFDGGPFTPLLGAFRLGVARMLALDRHAGVVLGAEPAPAGKRTDPLIMAAQGRQRRRRRFLRVERGLGEAVEAADREAGGLSPVSVGVAGRAAEP